MNVTTPAPDGFAPECRAVPDPLPAPAAWVIVRGEAVVLATPDGGAVSLVDDPTRFNIAPENVHALGAVDGLDAFLGEVSDEVPLPDGLRADSLRAAFALLAPAQQAMAAYGVQIHHWDRTSRHCGECGRAISRTPDPTRRSKRCPDCSHEWFPRVAPCTITLVHDEQGRMLLTRQATWPAGRYGLVAGFVEAGETLEDCVRRETLEETGVVVGDVSYAGSQPWPFPHQLMVGFTARYLSGDARPRDGELEDARWFARDALPMLPPRFSIARRLIDAFLAA